MNRPGTYPDRALAFLERAFLKTRYANFCWSLVWNITYVCNGRCIYCGVPKESQHPDVFKVLDGLAHLRPKDLLILGGEPMLHPDIVRIVPEAKKRFGNPSVTMSTNLSSDKFVEDLCVIVPFLDRLQVSLDALEEVNERIRGVNGDAILARMLRIHKFIARKGERCQLFTQSVVTRQSLEVLEDFVRKASAKMPGILMGFSMVTPYSSPLSIAHDREALSCLVNLIQKLQCEKYNVNICDRLIQRGCASIPYSSDIESHYGTDSVVAPAVRCRRQYFITQVLPSGRLWRCKPEQFSYEFTRVIREKVASREYLSALRWLGKALDTMIIRRHGDYCPFPCICNRYIEDILLAEDSRKLSPHNLHRLIGKFRAEDIRAVNAFLFRQYEKGIAPEVASVIVRGEPIEPGSERQGD